MSRHVYVCAKVLCFVFKNVIYIHAPHDGSRYAYSGTDTATHTLLAWKFFTVSEQDTKLTIFHTSKPKVGRGGTNTKTFVTTNLIRHLQHHHLTEDSQFKEPNVARAQSNQQNKPAVSAIFHQQLKDQSHYEKNHGIHGTG